MAVVCAEPGAAAALSHTRWTDVSAADSSCAVGHAYATTGWSWPLGPRRSQPGIQQWPSESPLRRSTVPMPIGSPGFGRRPLADRWIPRGLHASPASALLDAATRSDADRRGVMTTRPGCSRRRPSRRSPSTGCALTSWRPIPKPRYSPCRAERHSDRGAGRVQIHVDGQRVLCRQGPVSAGGDLSPEGSGPGREPAPRHAGRVLVDGQRTATDDPRSSASRRTVPLEEIQLGTVALLRTLKTRPAADRLVLGLATRRPVSCS
jgi:hypothetical protein